MSIFKRFSSNNDKKTKEKNKKVSFFFDESNNNNNANNNNDITMTMTETTDENGVVDDDTSSRNNNNDESMQLWYTKDEENEFRRRDQKMKNLLFNGTYTLADIEINLKESSRGLEYACDYNSAVQIMNRRQNSVMAVIATQKIFYKQGYKDCTEAIAIAYDMACGGGGGGGGGEQAISSAIERAKSDEQFVEDHVRRQIFRDSLFIKERDNNSKRQRREERPPLMGRQTAKRSLSVHA